MSLKKSTFIHWLRYFEKSFFTQFLFFHFIQIINIFSGFRKTKFEKQITKGSKFEFGQEKRDPFSCCFVVRIVVVVVVVAFRCYNFNTFVKFCFCCFDFPFSAAGQREMEFLKL